MAEKEKKKLYSEQTAKDMIKGFNESIQGLMEKASSEENPEKLGEYVTSSIAGVVTTGLGGKDLNSDYMRNFLPEEAYKLAQAYVTYKTHPVEAIQMMAKIMPLLQAKVVTSYVAGYVKEHDIKGEQTEEDKLEIAVKTTYDKLMKEIYPEKDKKEESKK